MSPKVPVALFVDTSEATFAYRVHKYRAILSKKQGKYKRSSAIIVSIMRLIRSVQLPLLATLATLLMVGLSPANATSANISHSYKSNSTIPAGSLVSLDSGRTDFVVPANTDNGSKLLGIAVAKDDSLIAVDAASGLVQVATNGSANALVSDVNGDIKVGDSISVSPFNGVGMKAETGQKIIGLAQTAFNTNAEGTKTESVTDKAGNRKNLRIGFIRIGIGVTTNSNSGDSKELNDLQKATKALVGREISTIRIILSLIVLIIASISLMTLIYAAIYGSIVSVGRNPLAKYAIFRTLARVLAMALITALIAVVTIFFLLR